MLHRYLRPLQIPARPPQLLSKLLRLMKKKVLRRTMRVETKKKVARDATKADAPAGEGRPQLEVSTSDAGITTSVTGNSSPVTERTEDESALADSGISENRRTLAERLLPKPRKTGVEECVPFIPDVWATLTQSW